ncbi:glycosyltransferase [Granulosicoccus sp.]|nr:glycosyltransferase [Granulosicoccus sp.]
MSDTGSSEQAQAPAMAFCIEELSVGGAEHMLLVMANEFVTRGWVVHMICLTKAGELASRLDESVQLHVLNKRRGIDPGLPWRLKRCVDEIKPDVINSHLWVANAWTRLSLLTRNIPVIVTEHSRDTWKPPYYRWIDKWLAPRAYRMVAVSRDTARFYEQSIGIDKHLITVINNGVDTALYAAGCGEELRKGWLAKSQPEAAKQLTPFLIGTVGRLVSAKNHQRLIDACAELINDTDLSSSFDIHVKIVGEGPERSLLQHYIDDLGLGHRISLAGARHDIPDVLAAFDVFVLSSDREGHPLTALEAQAAGTPVILTDAGGSSEAIARQGENVGGVLVRPSVETLSDAIRQMILDPQLRHERAVFARSFALRNFDKQQMLDCYEILFRAASDPTN